MHKLTLKKLPNFDYKESLLGILKNSPMTKTSMGLQARGFTVDEVRKSIKAIEVLGKAKEQVEFEDDIWEHIKNLVLEQKFIVASKELVEFINDIEEVK